MSCYPEPLLEHDRINNYFATVPLYANILSCFKLGRTVHPLQPVAPEYSEFFHVSSRRRIRLIHIKPSIENTNKNVEEKVCRKSDRLSTDEYWFTRWNRPMRNQQCNCSFRRSQRYSKYNDRLSLVPVNKHTSHDLNGKITDGSAIEKYAEALICNILISAFKEYAFGCIVSVAGYYTKNTDHTNETSTNDHKLEEISAKDEEVVYRKKSEKTCSHPRLHGIKKKAKPLVLLLHGIGSSSDIWWDVLQCLVCAGYEVIAPDMLGHGFSSVPNCSKAYTFSNLLKDTITIFDKYVPCTELGQCIVIGHSFGCSLAGALARYREQQIVQLVLISGGGPTPLAPPVSSTDSTLFDCMQEALMKPLLFCGIKRTIFYSSRGKHFDAVCDAQTHIPEYVLRYISDGQHWPEGDAAFHRRILIPTLLVHGLQDTCVTLVQECEMERTIPRSFLEVIPTAGHLAMLETPKQLTHMLLCFFDWWTK